jgi:energy-coupling factor transporter ATP-binding protein EcfA2
MSAAQEILNWSSDRPLWQRDALRRIVVKGGLDESDLDELALIAEQQVGLIDPSAPAPKAVPLAATHLPASTTAEAVSLRAITDIENVNALARDQKLSFESQGLTVIYGDNATGKSGYVRILKKLCRARATKMPILPNVFEAQTTDPARASVEFVVGTAPAKLSWQEGSASPDDLSVVSVFDSPSAAVYVNNENHVAYLPFGLDLLHKLAEGCGRIGVKLEQEQAADSSKLDPLPQDLTKTPSGQWLNSISQSTQVCEIDDHASLSDQGAREKKRLDQLLVEQRPAQRAAELEAKRDRYGKLRDLLLGLAGVVTSKRIEEFEQAHCRLRQAEKAAALATAQRFGNLPIPIVGSEAWEHLWEAAEEFKREIHASHAGLTIESPERCPLCQQVLDEDARARFEGFADYFLTKSQSDEASKREAFEQVHTPFAELPLGEDLYTEVLNDLRIDDPKVESPVCTYLECCRAIQTFAEAAKSSAELPARPPLATFDPAPLCDIIEQIGAQVQGLRAASDPEKREPLREKASELEAKAWLADRREQLIAEMERQKRQARFRCAIGDTVTTGITHKATELTRRYVTDKLRAAFATELSSITGDAPNVELVGRPGEKGVSYYRLELHGATVDDAKIDRVLSEGELRVISLAAFLSELSTEETKSAVVLDDPISSLDVHSRERVAERIVKLASERQVIVFTHDVFFVVRLLEEARPQKIAASTCMLVKYPIGAGVVTGDVPWEAKKFTALVGALKDQCQTARAEAAKGSLDAFGTLLSQICRDLRKTIERAVEEVLLREIVMRYRRQVHVSNLRQLDAIEKDDLELLDRLMTRYSSPQHSQTPESRVPPPSIDQVERDIEALDAWARAFRKKVEAL